MRGDRNRWKLVCLVGFSATVSTGLLAAPPVVKYGETALAGDAAPGQGEDSTKPARNNTANPDSVDGGGDGKEKRDAKVQNILRNALIAPDQARATGDPILDGVLDVIQERGSVVAAWLPETLNFEATGDTQALPKPQPQFPQPQFPQPQFPQPQFPQPQLPRVNQFSPAQPVQGQHPNYPSLYSHQPPPSVVPPNNDSGRAGVHDSIPSPQHEQQFLLAEQLLMTARLLSADMDRQERGRDEGQRRQLIRMLREEAARCLNTQSRTHMQPPAPHGNQAPHLNVPAY